MYRVTIDKDACDGIFACLVRDGRFEEGADGLATVDPASAEEFTDGDERVVATFDDGRVAAAREAAAACPPNAISVEKVDAGEGTEEVTEPCR